MFYAMEICCFAVLGLLASKQTSEMPMDVPMFFAQWQLLVDLVLNGWHLLIFKHEYYH